MSSIATHRQSSQRRRAGKSRADKAEEIKQAIRDNWRTHSDREMSELVGATPTTVGKYRKEMENAGEILPRVENGHSLAPCLREVSISAILPAPENDTLYDLIRQDDPAFVALVDDICEHGILQHIIVSRDGYVLSGHRRLAAAVRLHLPRVPVEIDPSASRADDPDRFLRLLRSHNTQRVKTTAEVIREGLVGMEPDAWQRVCDYRETVSNIDGVEVFRLVGAKIRSAIVQKRGLADAIVKIVIEYYHEYGATSDRKIFYLLLNVAGLLRNDVHKTPFLNSNECYQDVTDLLTRLRLDGSIPFEAIMDETRPVIQWNTHRSVGPFIQRELENLFSGYWRDLIQSQPNWIELLVEKNTVATALKPIAAKYTMPMTSGRGYSSLPPRKGMVDRFRASGRQKLIVIVVSDFDSEGQDIPNSFGLSLRDDVGIEPDKLVIIKAALTHEQTQTMELHEGQMAKEDSARYQRFVEAYGPRCWELEAIPTDTLREILEATIRRTLDIETFDAELAKERKEQAELDAHRRRVKSALSDISFGTEVD